MSATVRTALGIVCMISGICLFLLAAHLGTEPGFSPLQRGLVVAASAIGGGVMIFAVSPRLMAPAD